MTTHIAKNPSPHFPERHRGTGRAAWRRTGAAVATRDLQLTANCSTVRNRYSRWALGETVAKGDTICLLMPNRPEFMAVWLGITRIGGVIALVNTNLIGASLAHCIDIVSPKHVIVAAEFMAQFDAIRPLLKSAPKVWVHGADGEHRIDTVADSLSGAPLAASERRALTIEDPALYIYTSGTTGLPKAANINHYRVMLACFGFAGMMGTKKIRPQLCVPADVPYRRRLCATGSLLVNGGSVYIRERFSVREFWDDIVNNDCTMMQYIGELCRYLVNAPPNPNETRHKLRLACGNGLRPDIWDEFKTRFRIPLILEFYAGDRRQRADVQSRGQDRRRSAACPGFSKHRFPTALVKFRRRSRAAGAQRRRLLYSVRPQRDRRGDRQDRQRRQQAGQPLRGLRAARGHRKEDPAACVLAERHLVPHRRPDAQGRERLFLFSSIASAIPFRWKGENVSTLEVAEAINKFPGIQDTNVYGVAVPGHEGRAGMAAIVCQDCDLPALYLHLQDSLPEYARPVFVRVRRDLDMTATFKQKKVDLVKQGFDPDTIADPIYFNDPSRRAFIPLDRAVYTSIRAGQTRV
jgi:fatty-acyl-CoA synthase